MSSVCPHCLNVFSACQCEPCASCGGLTFRDEFSYVHVCSSAWGELTTALMPEQEPDGYYMPSGVRGYTRAPLVVTSVLGLARVASTEQESEHTRPVRAVRR